MRHLGPIGAFLLAAFAVADVTTSGPARVISDINDAAGPESHGWPQAFVDLGDVTIFFASTRTTGFELWRTDGTETGTTLVKDIYPGVRSCVEEHASATPSDLVVARVGHVAFFAASDGVHGVELWRSDGTEAGTFLLADIREGPGSGLGPGSDPFSRRQPFTYVVAGGLVYFPASDGTHGVELWRTDGTSAGTFMVRDIRTGSGDAVGTDRLEAAAVGETLFFSAGDDIHGRELWKTDGTEVGTVRLTDLPPGGAVYRLEGEAGGVLLFFASDKQSNLELWRSDGTESGTFLLKDIHPTRGSIALVPTIVANEKLFFLADDEVHGYELWRSDGTAEGTFLLNDVRPGPESAWPMRIDGADGANVYFSTDDGVHGNELWVSDGTEAGTHLVADIIPGPGGSFDHVGFTRVGDHLYFVVNDAVHGPEVWTTDGTAGGTRQVTNLLASFGPYDLAAVGGRLFYVRGESAHGVEPWSTDGVDGGTLLRDIYPGDVTSYSFTRPGRRGDLLLFGANDRIHGVELWSTDGTPDGTRLLKNLNEFQRSAPSIFELSGVELGQRLLFVAADARNKGGLWLTDGTGDGTRLVEDIVPSNPFGSPTEFGDLGERAVFAAYDALRGAELWVSDGTEDGTHVVKDLRPGASESSPSMFISMGSKVVFTANDGASGQELWVTDGTEQGTELLADIQPGPDSSGIGDFTRLGELVVFRVGDGTSNRSLWRTDGTSSGTYPLVALGTGYPSTPVVFRGAAWFDVGVGPEASELWKTDGTPEGTERVAVMDVDDAFDFSAAGDLLFFAGYTAASGVELWVTDGTGPGARLGGYLTGLTAVGDLVFFVAEDPQQGWELWRSDGTAEGTRLVKDIDTSEDGSRPEQLTEVEGVLLFSANDAEHGRELWRSDGTSAGTFLVQDLLPGPESSSPGTFVPFGTRIAFAATGDVVGREPWAGRPSILTRQPVRAIEDLADQVRTLDLQDGAETALVARLDAAAAALSRRGGSRIVLKILDGFAREIERMSPPIPQRDAADLLDFVREIQQLLGVANGSAPAVPVGRRLEERGLEAWR